MSARASRGAVSRLHVVLLAGGSGTRFWPASRASRPKQFLPLAGERSLIDETWRRVRVLVPPDRLWVVAPAALAAAVREHLPRVRENRLILEPSPRDTAPAIALACATVARRDPGATVAIFPTDHVVRDGAAFREAVARAVEAARKGALVCLGVRPDRPATGYGYLRTAGRAPARGAARVERFVEKPDLARARRFLRSGRYLWNGGMFVWRVERFQAELERAAPEVARAISRHLDGRPGAWSRAPRRSVDYAVMERARDVAVVPLDAGWDDVGSWAAAARLRESTSRPGDSILVASPRSVVFGEGRAVAVVGVEGVVVVETADAVLVVSRDRAESVREVVDELRRRRRTDLL